MTKVKRGNVARKRRKKILNLAKGFKGAHSKLFRVANQQVMKSLRYSYIGRKNKKRQFRSLWISRINAECRHNDTNYSLFINSLKKSNIDLNRKMLAQLAIIDKTTFSKILLSSS
uniref:ribosomal protein L20 n=1 Tax=Pseudoerythrocladia kornmannii TaxID=753682 RepID=UPI001BEF6809|nr:ribosomal protein L20 [Pseudoerythrocladia kornmannii]QUE28355.1 ribosomal protein L20 [Pseudoerythrocladia kornmannii]UNJ16859.1 ribosomal protein L20 [Pseudoerythrocladia kornmannii]